MAVVFLMSSMLLMLLMLLQTLRLRPPTPLSATATGSDPARFRPCTVLPSSSTEISLDFLVFGRFAINEKPSSESWLEQLVPSVVGRALLGCIELEQFF